MNHWERRRRRWRIQRSSADLASGRRPQGEAVTLNNIGVVYQSLGETQKALEKHNEALPIRPAVGDRSGEAHTLNNIGVVYRSLGETQKALEKYNEALPLRRAVGDRNGEAVTLLGIARVEQKRGNLTQARQTVEQAIGIDRIPAHEYRRPGASRFLFCLPTGVL